MTPASLVASGWSRAVATVGAAVGVLEAAAVARLLAEVSVTGACLAIGREVFQLMEQSFSCCFALVGHGCGSHHRIHLRDGFLRGDYVVFMSGRVGIGRALRLNVSLSLASGRMQ